MEQELELGLCSLAVPVCDPQGRIMAALNVSTPYRPQVAEYARNELLPALRTSRQADRTFHPYQQAAGKPMNIRTVYLCDGIRTPFGRYKGGLSGIRTDDLAALPLASLVDRYPRIAEAIDEIILGCANQSGEDNRNVARMAGLLAGLPVSVPAYTVNRLCASGLEAIGQGARAIALGDADLILAGGVESMSRAPYVMAKAQDGFERGQQLEDTTLGWRMINPRMRAMYGVDSMAQTAENLAGQFGISREDQDAFAYRSQRRAAQAIADGVLDADIMPVTALTMMNSRAPTPRWKSWPV